MCRRRRHQLPFWSVRFSSSSNDCMCVHALTTQGWNKEIKYSSLDIIVLPLGLSAPLPSPTTLTHLDENNENKWQAIFDCLAPDLTTFTSGQSIWAFPQWCTSCKGSLKCHNWFHKMRSQNVRVLFWLFLRSLFHFIHTNLPHVPSSYSDTTYVIRLVHLYFTNYVNNSNT